MDGQLSIGEEPLSGACQALVANIFYRAVYAGNLVLARRLLQHPDINISLRDWEGELLLLCLFARVMLTLHYRLDGVRSSQFHPAWYQSHGSA